MTESPEELAAVEQLLAESDSVRGWLVRLDQASSTIPDSVRRRVRDDYQRRLDDVTAGLRAHGDVIAAKLSDDRSEHAELESRSRAAREALAEAELRHAVGEYDAERFDNERRRHSSDVETYQLSLDAVAERIARLEQIHALVEGAPRPPMLDVELPAIDEVAVSEEPASDVPATDSVPIGDLAPEADSALAIFDDLAEPADDDAAGSAELPVPETGPLSFRPSGIGAEPPRQVAAPPATTRPFDHAPPLGIPTADIPPRFVRPGERLGRHPAPPAAPPVAEVAPEPVRPAGEGIVATGTGAETSGAPVGRTLRCGECGAMNRPLEWYCEKCGAELTAV